MSERIKQIWRNCSARPMTDTEAVIALSFWAAGVLMGFLFGLAVHIIR